MNDDTSEAHLFAWSWVDVEGVVVAVQSVEHRCVLRRGVLVHSIGLLALWWREVLALGTLGTSPTALSDEECRANDARVDFVRLGVDYVRLCLHDSAWLALVVDSKNCVPALELPALGGCGKSLVEDHLSLAIENASAVQLGNSGDVCSAFGLSSIEVDHFLGSVLEGEDDGVCWEGSKVLIEFLEEAY